MSIFEKLFGRKKRDNPEATAPALPENTIIPVDDTSSDDEEDEDVAASGWDAIDAALQPIYGDQEPAHYGTAISYNLGGPDPIQGISAYKREEPVRHWHYVTYGFSELYEKESDNPELSGWGFELTFRLCVDMFDEYPPVWAVNFLQNLARYVFNSGRVFKAGDYMNANGPIAADVDTAIRAIAFVQDPELPAIDTPNGAVQFLQVVGLTEDEELALKQWNTQGTLGAFQPHMPLYVTDLQRTSLMQIDTVRQQVLEGAEREGSSTAYLFVDQLAVELQATPDGSNAVHLTLGAAQVPAVLSLLPYRLRFGNHFGLLKGDTSVWFKSGDHCEAAQEEDSVSITLTNDALDALCQSLKPQQGIYPCPTWDKLVIEVRPTLIKDQNGAVVRTIGE